MSSTHTYAVDSRNADIQININGELFARDQAVVSVFDGGFILGAVSGRSCGFTKALFLFWTST